MTQQANQHLVPVCAPACSPCSYCSPPRLHAASFDCTKAEKPVEKAICSDPKLSAADSSMATLYRNSLAQLSSTSIGLLRADQLQWLAWIQQLCHANDGLFQTAEMANCLQPLYADRIKALRKSVLRRDGMSFLFRTQYLAAPDTEPVHGKPEHPGFGTVQASWPAADSTDEDWVSWNHAVETRMIRLAARPEESSAQRDWADDMADGLDATVEAHLKSIEHDRVTTGLSLSAMAHGGAHPYELWETQTYLLDKKRALRADDVFRPDADWKKVMSEAAWHQMSTGDKKQYIYDQIKGPDAKEIQQVLLNTGNWTLEHDGIHISYPEYSVSPRYALMDDAVIPWTALQPLLVHTFSQP